jgi:hypothetical protein
VVRAAAASASFKLADTTQEVAVRLDTDGRQREIVIDVPQPVSPQALGLSGDTRALGLALKKIEIGTTGS